MNPPPPNEDREQPAALNYERHIEPPPWKMRSLFKDVIEHLSLPGWVVGWPLLVTLVWGGFISYPRSSDRTLIAWLFLCTGFALSFVSLFNRRRRLAGIGFIVIYGIILVPLLYLAWPYFIRRWFD